MNKIEEQIDNIFNKLLYHVHPDSVFEFIVRYRMNKFRQFNLMSAESKDALIADLLSELSKYKLRFCIAHNIRKNTNYIYINFETNIAYKIKTVYDDNAFLDFFSGKISAREFLEYRQQTVEEAEAELNKLSGPKCPLCKSSKTSVHQLKTMQMLICDGCQNTVRV